MGNLDLYRRYSQPPKEALKTIKGGRLNGYTDINPMWRILALTEAFGPCGTGWKYTIDRQWTEPGANGEIAAFCNISLYIKAGEGWSEAIPGTGGASFVAKERSGLYTSDEGYKMALTDALSVACKALGIGANVYWSGGRTKYTQGAPEDEILCEQCGKPVREMQGKDKQMIPASQVAKIGQIRFGKTLCGACQIKAVGRDSHGQANDPDAGGRDSAGA